MLKYLNSRLQSQKYSAVYKDALYKELKPYTYNKEVQAVSFKDKIQYIFSSIKIEKNLENLYFKKNLHLHLKKIFAKFICTINIFSKKDILINDMHKNYCKSNNNFHNFT